MGKLALSRLPLRALVDMSVPLLKRAECEVCRTGRGRPPEYPDWVVGVLIMVAVLKRKKTKSAQFVFLTANSESLQEWLGIDQFPSRSTYYDRYRRAYRLYQAAIRLQGAQAIKEGAANAICVAADKSLIPSRGPQWHKKQRQAGICPRGVDRESTWTYSEYHGWIQGYGYEVVVSAGHRSISFPLLASVDQAHVREHRTFEPKICQLAKQTKYVLVDAGYDSNALAEAVEWSPQGRRTGRFYLCPQTPPKRRASKTWRTTRQRQLHHRLREARRVRFKRHRFRRIYARRSKNVEPFNDHFKGLFELHDQVWHRGLDNNRTQLLAGIFCYQLLVRYNLRLGNRHRRIKNLLNNSSPRA